MNYWIEALCIGIYTQCLASVIVALHTFELKFSSVYNTTAFLFVLGFLKHGLGDLIGLHTYYCNICASQSNRVSDRTIGWILFESIGEGCLFVLAGLSLMRFLHPRFLPFVIGFSFHVLFEVFGFHRIFCKYRCKTVN